MRFRPGFRRRPVACCTCGEGSQTGEVKQPGKLQQVPAKRQNRGSRNSTGDVIKKKGDPYARISD
uniref:Single-stranded DNA-binding protein n=1 Tax=Citrobacter freundii TaxID=546 RepID=A0A3T0VED6_CITFR|nr:single-stranded DNA-binding protein [Citrobacter freundii]